MEEESYILATTEIEYAHVLTMDTNTIPNEPQQVLNGVGRRETNKTITPPSALRYARRVIVCVN